MNGPGDGLKQMIMEEATDNEIAAMINLIKASESFVYKEDEEEVRAWEESYRIKSALNSCSFPAKTIVRELLSLHLIVLLTVAHLWLNF